MLDRTVRSLCAAAQGAFTLRHSILVQLVASFLGGALVSGAVLAFAMNTPPANGAAARKPARSATAAPPALAGPSALDLLRNAAASGDEFSNWELSNALMDRYDVTADPEELYEAMVWVDRRWGMSGKTELAARVTAHYCGQRVVRWHWLCNLGE